MSTSKEQKIIEEARKYVGATRLYSDIGRSDIGRHIGSVQQRYLSQLLQARNEEQHAEIVANLQKDINRSVDEAVKRISPPIIALNGLVEASDEPVYFNYEGQELMVVPNNDQRTSYQKFSVRLKDEGPETAV